MTFEKTLGSILTILGVFLLLFAGYAVLTDGAKLFGRYISEWGSIVPFVLGVIFFSAGIRLIRS